MHQVFGCSATGLHVSLTLWQVLRDLSLVLTQSKKTTWKLTKKVAHLWYLKEKWFPAHILYIHSAFIYTQAHTNMQVRSSWHRAGRKVVSVVLLLLSFLCTEQSSIRRGYFYIRKLSYCSITDKAQANLAVTKWRVKVPSFWNFCLFACFNEKRAIES